MRKIDSLRDKHKKEIQDLQNNCSHKESTWLNEDAGLCHFTGYIVKSCNECEKALGRKKGSVPIFEDV